MSKKGWIIAAIIVIVVVIIFAVSGNKNKTENNGGTDTDNTSAQTTTENTTAPTTEDKSDAGKISKTEFDQIKNGMSYEEVVEIIGGPGEMMSESGASGDQYYTVMYSWKGEGTIGANATMMFQGGKLINKSQFGLE